MNQAHTNPGITTQPIHGHNLGPMPVQQFEAVEHLVDNLTDILNRENAQLADTSVDFTDNCAREKLQLISSINRITLDVGQYILPDGLQLKIQSALALLKENEKALSTRMRAIEEVADTISQAIQEADSDGTYDRISTYGSFG